MTALLILLLSIASAIQSPALAPGSTVARSIASTASHTFDLALDANRTILFDIEQTGVDLDVTVTDPDGILVAQTLDFSGGTGRGQLLVAADKSGTFVVRVSARPWP